jgi:hypothetical protein
VAVSCEHGNGPSGPIKCGEVIDQLSEYKLQHKHAPSSKLVKFHL